MRLLIASLFILLVYSCIPYSIAPKIEGDKLVKAKRFKGDLPRNYGFVFKDPKDADEFYTFINAKYDLRSIDVQTNVPIWVGDRMYYLSFYERERTTKTFNLIPLIIDNKLENSGKEPMLEDFYVSRSGQWYLILMVTDDDLQDCLDPNYPHRQEITQYLRALRDEYLLTHNYMEAYLRGGN